ncbi:hypothetical protein PGIGA_G00001190 [Pangasianodon gigas]|uniref:Uncharacterized protein n=1 Tax=Pangasianodon gigas TaxID=30993 RepID=A0ACC5W5A1_PANGG|nr:hypothetical protein [Pangasianodon gigas]
MEGEIRERLSVRINLLQGVGFSCRVQLKHCFLFHLAAGNIYNYGGLKRSCVLGGRGLSPQTGWTVRWTFLVVSEFVAFCTLS